MVRVQNRSSTILVWATDIEALDTRHNHEKVRNCHEIHDPTLDVLGGDEEGDYEDYSGLDPVDDLVTSIEEDGIANEELEPDENGNYVIGDMVLTADQYSADFLGLEEFSGIRGDNYRWPNGVIPYQIDGSISRDSSLVLIKRGRGGCGSSSVGRQGGRQTLSISVGCFNDRTIIHEFIHAFGYYHEQSRPDRDSFVRIVFNNIRRQNQHNFRKQVNGLTFNVPYDGLSIMHYSSRAFSKNRGNTIESKIPTPNQTTIHQPAQTIGRDNGEAQPMENTALGTMGKAPLDRCWGPRIQMSV
eukprot:maker-scaffold97_size377342-snap-gene-1.15 protein:Tk12114 transcript:maker-scaffold97_size377342-snap-gene-1.15-mRNA-1 annotation:"zinc metalloproteinase nas-8-like"